MNLLAKYLLCAFLLGMVFGSSAQQTTPTKKGYISFLKHDSLQTNTYLTASYSFIYTSVGKISQGGRGSCLSVGLNLARFFSKKIVLGVTFDYQLFSGLWQHQFRNN